ncbi:META domain-containing protein [Kribbella sp. NPDC048915]|uniref:META domain-containing protein n=1 Tax=Kribbella sp. NPDC048915 TaxID=3155148 RepID=UPI0033F3167A
MISLVATALLAVAACGNEAGAAGGGSLAGRTFLSATITEKGQPRPLLKGTRIQLRFTDDGRLSWDAGCNTSQTKVSTDNGRLKLDGEIMMTTIGCPKAIDEQSAWLGSVLAAKPAWKLGGDKLELTTESTTISLLDRETAEPDVAVDGMKWTLSTVITGETASHSAGSDQVWLTLNGDRVTGSTGCNMFQGKVARGTGSLTFGELATTRRACTGDAQTLEASVVKLLKGELSYEVDGTTLKLRSAAGNGLDFVTNR